VAVGSAAVHGLMLGRSTNPALAILVVAMMVAVSSAAVVAVSLRKGAAVSRRRIRAGAEGMIGRIGVVRSWGETTGKVLVDGALWHARHSWLEEAPEQELHVGDQVVVERLNGLTLGVRAGEAVGRMDGASVVSTVARDSAASQVSRCESAI